jgi:hypothetical protein
MIVDFEQDFLRQILSLIDGHIKKIEERAKAYDDPDSLGFYDDMDHLTGIGFVACQRYLTGTCSFWKIDKVQALSLAPFLTSGVPFVTAVNAAANYWKHHSEWGNVSKRRKESEGEKRTKQILFRLGYKSNTNYVVANILHDLTRSNMQALLPFLVEWRNNVVALKKEQGQPSPACDVTKRAAQED